MKTFLNVNVLQGKSFIKTNLSFDKTFIDVEGDQTDMSNRYIVPGLIDRHTHGAFGVDFNWAKEDDIKKVLDFYLSQGVTSVYPTILSDSKEKTKKQLSFISNEIKKYPMIKGIHLEGPFLSYEYKGAMPEEYLSEPSKELLDEFIKASNNTIKILTIAPELNNACELISYAKEKGIVVSLGHTSATFDEGIKGIDAGASVHTHFMNANRLSTQHEAGITGAVYFDDRIAIEQICDGRHLCKETAKLNYKIKGEENFCLITDSIMAAGLDDGRYMLGANEIDVIEGDAVLADNHKIRAGSTLTMINAVKNAAIFLEIGISKSFYLGSMVPARLQGINNEYGSIEIGKKADFIVLDKDFNILETYIEGTRVYKKND